MKSCIFSVCLLLSVLSIFWNVYALEPIADTNQLLLEDLSPDLFQLQFNIDGFSRAQSFINSNSEVAMKTIHKEAMKVNSNNGMVKGKRAKRASKHEVVFSIQHLNLLEAENILNDISDPKSSNFGNHMTREEINALTANPEASVLVISYLNNKGVTVLNDENPMYITAEAPVHVWETMFDTQFFEYTHSKRKDVTVIRTDQYSLPELLSEHVAAVFNTVQLPDTNDLLRNTVKSRRFKQTPGPVPSDSSTTNDIHLNTVAAYNGYITPARLNSYYNITSNNGHGYGSQAIYSSIGQIVSPSDLAWFRSKFELPADTIDNFLGGHKSDNACVINGVTDTTNCGEANLDAQYLMSVAYNIPTTSYYWNGTDYWLGFCQAVSAMTNPPKVITMSYSSYELSYATSYLNLFNTEALKLSLMGVTLLSASGDDGVMGFQEERPQVCGYDPQFPACSPYVTSVGATMGPQTTGNIEIACTSDQGGVITSGGGFSNVYPTPAWQQSVVTTYLETVSDQGNEPHKGYSPTGRGYPDVSLAGYAYLVAANKQLLGESGTSASTPVFAGFVSLVKAKRLAAGKSTLGWINPSLYALYDQFILNDITSGENNCIIDAYVCCDQGFTATTGWDPITGLGSINYGKFEAVMVALGSNINKPTNAPTPLPGSPTVLPTTAGPSLTPSAMPTSTPGWYYETAYEGTDCTGDVIRMDGMRTGLCQLYSYRRSNLAKYAKVYCNDDIVTLTLYNSVGCTGTPYYTTTQNTNFCAVSASAYGLDAVVVNSYRYQCASTTTLPVPSNEAYLISRFYNSDSTCSSANAVSSFVAIPQNKCIHITLSSAPLKILSVTYTNPTSQVYNGSICTAPYILSAFTNTVSTTCSATKDDDANYGTYQDDFSRNQGNNKQSTWQSSGPSAAPSSAAPSISPSKRPTRLPTSASPTLQPTTAVPSISLNPTVSPTTYSPSQVPTVKPTTALPTVRPTLVPTARPTTAQLYQFDVSQNLAGITASDYRTNFVVNNAAFCHAVSVVIDINVADCTVHSVTDGATTRRLRTLTASSIDVSYTVAYNLVALGYANAPDTAFSALTSGLTTGVNNGNFTSALQSYAVANGNTALTSVTSSSVTPASSYTAVGGNNGNKKNNTTLIIGVVVGGGGGLILLVVLCLYFCGRSKNNSTAPANTQTVHVAPPPQAAHSYAIVTKENERNL